MNSLILSRFGLFRTAQNLAASNSPLHLTPFASYSCAHFAQTGQLENRSNSRIFNSFRTLAKNNGDVALLFHSFAQERNASPFFSFTCALLRCTPGVHLLFTTHSPTSACSLPRRTTIIPPRTTNRLRWVSLIFVGRDTISQKFKLTHRRSRSFPCP